MDASTLKYPQRWRGFWLVVSTAGIGLALLQWRWWTVAAPFAAMLVAMTLVIVAGADAPDRAGQLPALTRRAAVMGAEITVAMVAFVAVSNVSTALTLWLLAAAAASSPWLVTRLLRAGARLPWPLTRGSCSPQALRVAMSAPVPVVKVVCMTTPELCQAWRRSFLLLAAARSDQERSRIVGCRQLYLDELERRSPLGLHAWLDSGARAASSPERYVAGDTGPEHPDAASS